VYKTLDDYVDDENKFNYLATLDYAPADGMLLYASTSTGYRSGGPGVAEARDPLTGAQTNTWGGFESEEITNFELGAKLDLLDNRMRLNVALFKQIYENYQFTRIIVPAGTSIVVRGVDNTDADISGGEIELTALLPAAITATITYGYTKAEIDGGDYDGEPLPGIPESDYSFNLNKPVPMGAGELDLMLNYSWKDSHFSELDAQDASGIDDIGLLNLSATYSQDNWSVAGFVNNATDEEYLTVTTYAFGGALNFAGVGMPRVAGVRAAYNF
jgi:iron complex outermembrane receptor protein